MDTTAFWGLGTLVIYPALFMGALVGVVLWDKHKRGTRNPFGRDVRLRRMPGEHLWQRVIEKDDSEMPWTLGLMLVPIIVSGLALQIASVFFGKTYISLLIALFVFLVAMVCCIVWLAGRLERREREYLGFFGERFVADCLEPLKEHGWFIFHDVPCDGASKRFNLDHVAVGPGGLWIVETKVRRKGRVRRGRDRNKVLFDGTKIIWPRWDDSASIRQAVKSADWLQGWLERNTEKTFEVSVVVTVPGYKVENGRSKMEDGRWIIVAAPEDLQEVLIGQGRAVLGAEDIKAIRLPLTAKSRDVEY